MVFGDRNRYRRIKVDVLLGLPFSARLPWPMTSGRRSGMPSNNRSLDTRRVHFCLGEIPERTSGETRATRSIFLERVRFAPIGYTIRRNDRIDEQSSEQKSLIFSSRSSRQRPISSHRASSRLPDHGINHIKPPPSPSLLLSSDLDLGLVDSRRRRTFSSLESRITFAPRYQRAQGA